METKEKRPVQRTKTADRKTGTPRKKTPDSQIVYTQPKAFNRGKLLLRLATVAAVVLALVFGMSIFFKVETVNVAGNDKYTPWDVQQASGISMGEGLLGLSKPQIAGKIKANLPYVEDVRIGIKLPNTVNIEIKELDVVYAIEADDSTWWLMDAQGRIVDKTDSAAATAYTRVRGVQLSGAVTGENAVAAEPEPDQTDEAGQTVPVTVKGSERLQTVITILQYLEDCGILGQADTVDVSDLGNIQIRYADRYDILLGDTTQLGYKVRSAKTAIDQMSDHQSGTLDVSFTIWPDEVGYTPSKADTE